MGACAVSNCKSNSDKRLKRNQIQTTSGVKFFRFPKDEKYIKIWLDRCARRDGSSVKVENMYMCSKHFEREAYARHLRHELLNYTPKCRKQLKLDAVPTLHLPPSVVSEKIVNKQDLSNVNQVDTADRNLLTKERVIDAESPQSTSPIPCHQNTLTHEKYAKNTKPSKLESNIDIKRNNMQFKFFEHVFLIWFIRARRYDPTNTKKVSLLKAKIKEVADNLDTYVLTPLKWLRAFKVKISQLQPQEEEDILRKSLTNITGIITEEWTPFLEKQGHLSNAIPEEETNKIEEPPIELYEEEEEFVEDTIETYEEALCCLRMVEDYALSSRNYRAVCLISQMEKILKNTQS